MRPVARNIKQKTYLWLYIALLVFLTIAARLAIVDTSVDANKFWTKTPEVPFEGTPTPTRVPTIVGSTCNLSAISINDAGPAYPYPSNITVNGLSGNITNVNVQVTGISHTYPDDIDMLLVGPNGGKVMLMSDTGGGNDIVNVNLTFADGNPALPDDLQITSGTYAPTDYVTGDIFPAPAPAGPYGTSLVTAFGGSSPNGIWSLYIVDDAGQDVGNITGGWCISFSTAVATNTPVAPTNTPVAPTNTPIAPTNTPPAPSATHTATSVPVQTQTSGPTATPQACNLAFTDVLPGSTFYAYIQCLACRGIINGYSTGCETGNPCFRPGNSVTRAQTAKIVANAAGFSQTPTGQQFTDVPVGSTFYDFIWRLADMGIVSGYPCGGPGEPCGHGNLPYFRPNAGVTRGQLAKIASQAAMFNEPPSGQQFQDVPPDSTFYPFIYRLVSRSIMSGYTCGNPEPCVPPANLPYFRPGSGATRGQTSKIVTNTFISDCSASKE